MAKTMFKRGRFWHYRIFINGKDQWRSTKQKIKTEAQAVADAAEDASKGRGDVESFFALLLERIAALPETEQPETRQRLARRLMMLQANVLPLADAWQIWVDSPAKGNPGADTVSVYAGYWDRFAGWAKEHTINYVHEVSVVLATR